MVSFVCAVLSALPTRSDVMVARDDSQAERLWLCLHFPALAVEVFTRTQEQAAPCMVRTGEGSAQRVYACCEQARAMGVMPGMRLSAAHALGALEVFPRQIELERDALQALAMWAARFTSDISICEPDALLLEVGGSLRLFDGAVGLREALKRESVQTGHALHMAGAPTPLAALWLARVDAARLITSTARLPGVLSSLPLDVLELPAKTLRSISGLGVATIGELARLPRAGLAKRFGPALLDTLDKALGRRPDPRVLFEMPRRFAREIEFPAPVPGGAALDFALDRLLRDMIAWLTSIESGVQRFYYRLLHEHAPATRLDIGLLRAGRDYERLSLVLNERLEQLTLPESVSCISLHADEVLPLAAHNAGLFDDAPAQAHGRGLDLIERLRARLGKEAVTRLNTVAEHRPEYAMQLDGQLGGHNTYFEQTPSPPGKNTGRDKYCVPAIALQDIVAERPLWLLPEPVALREREGRPVLKGVLQLGASCERLQSGWWDGGDLQRDYFIAEDRSGQRLWVYRDLKTRAWYLHGLFD